MYSIASSQAMHKDNVQTTVRVVRYESHGRDRQGVASGHLGDRAGEGTTMPIFLHSNNNFRLPEDTTMPVIMIGPGTGIAPFRAFLEERQATGQTGDNWLFFGEQREAMDFLYKDQFQAMHKDGVLTRLDTAFSRDQARKVYVQDRMQERCKELYEWLERGAYFYVCGDATRMAKDVETALLDVIASGSNGTLDHAAEYLASHEEAKALPARRLLKPQAAQRFLSGRERRLSFSTTWGSSTLSNAEYSQLQLSDSLTPESRETGSAPLVEIETMAQYAVKQRIVQDIPQEFLSAIMEASAQTTMAFMATHPASAENFKPSGSRCSGEPSQRNKCFRKLSAGTILKQNRKIISCFKLCQANALRSHHVRKFLGLTKCIAG